MHFPKKTETNILALTTSSLCDVECYPKMVWGQDKIMSFWLENQDPR